MSSPHGLIRHVIFDVDDVLLEMEAPTRAAERAVLVPLTERFDPATAARVQQKFSAGYWTLIRHLRLPPGQRDVDYEVLRPRIDGWQRGLREQGHEVKQWSRDSLMAIALEDAGIPPTRALLEEVLAHYWRTLAESTRIYPDAAELIGQLRARGISFHLATNSDGFLVFDDDAGTFRYDPPEAVAKKIRRLGALTGFGIAERSISVGDPIGKPEAAFYQRVLSEFSAQVGRPLDLAATLAVGDSLTNDVLPFLAQGVGQGAWLVREEAAALPSVDGQPRVRVCRSLTELLPALGDADAA